MVSLAERAKAAKLIRNCHNRHQQMAHYGQKVH